MQNLKLRIKNYLCSVGTMKIINKTIELGLYLLIFLLPFQTRWIVRQGTMSGWPYEFGTLSLYAIDILLVVLLILNAYAKINLQKSYEQKDANISLVWWLIGGVELLTFISIFVAIDKAVALQSYLRLLLGIGLFWLIISAIYEKQKLINIFIGSAVVQALLGVWQFLMQASFANKWLGMAKHLPIDIGDSVITATNGERWLRAYGGLDHPNIFGGLMAIALLMVLTRLILPQEPLPASPFVKGRGTILYCVIIILTCGLFFSFSRAAWLGFVAGVIIILIGRLPWQKVGRRASACSPSGDVPNPTPTLSLRRRGGALSVAIIVVTFLALSAVFHNLISVRALDSTVTENKSINDRLSSYKIDAEILKDNWLLGVGVGNYGLAGQNKFPGLSYNDYQPMHNVFLLIFSEIGIIGFVCFCSLFIYLIYRQWKIEDIYGVSIIISIFVMFLFDHWWWSLHFGILFIFLICGMLVKSENDCE